jgi:hypothetical protein
MTGEDREREEMALDFLIVAALRGIDPWPPEGEDADLPILTEEERQAVEAIDIKAIIARANGGEGT